ncbi:16S rRNA (cytosine(1402)-N(4))-methyltransferase RsmH [Cochlodiniinecator piscidefendens]|uniref:16S rRNA (cytosine(1402)-N(4))-methyltransferase RsmH n=1 Tax=Cochlodiniinecator piscidefendens TaxID=2715756 RepID=UPI001409E1C2|nr:16S rRNA (cytosine(1402)-N(4))-methyltransferase RsmH [Cochlodiniinecator piscidefendens]
MAPLSPPSENAPHIPVLLRPLLAAVAPISGQWLDGTFGAGGYTRGLLDAGADCVYGVDRDPMVFDMAQEWAADYGDRLKLVEGTFSKLDEYPDGLLDGVVLDLGVSSMQLDQAERGFSFMKDGPLDMRMSQTGPSAADIVNEASEAEIADILFQYGEERASRRIAKAIVVERANGAFETTLRLAELIENTIGRGKPGGSHPATRSFQALRIAVNDEFGQLIEGLEAAERALKPGGQLAVVTFHSMEDRVVKKFFQARTGGGARVNRYAPMSEADLPRFTLKNRKAIGPDDIELAENPRSRSAKLRVALRTEAPAEETPRKGLGLPKLSLKG